jgi:hypothetical protein
LMELSSAEGSLLAGSSQNRLTGETVI